MYKEVKLYDEPEKGIRNFIDVNYSEMTLFQRSFLCGLIKENRPQKIVEVGVSAGGTTVLLLECLKILNIKAEMYSVDLMEKWYRNEKYETGFVAKNFLSEHEIDIRHEFLLGKSIPFFLKRIGKDVDFLILDTAHTLPGEFLDFIVTLPYLKSGCIVVMHDTIENHLICRDIEIATKLLFDVVCADDKYYMWEDGINVAELSNIAAFKVKENTKENIRDLFSAMTISWGYLLKDTEREKYRESILENYGKEYQHFFDKVEILQRNTYYKKLIMEHYGKDAEYLKMKWKREKNVILYGAGHYAELYYHWAMLNNLCISGLVISDGQEKKVCRSIGNLPIYFLSELPYKSNECAIVLAIDRLYHRMVLQNLENAKYDNVL